MFYQFKMACKKAKLVFFILLIGFIASCSPQGGSVVPQALAAWKNPDILTQLKTGKVISKVPMREFLSSKGKQVEFEGQVFLVELDNGLKAVFKCLSEDEMDDAYAEVAAYHASVELGFPYVPPTVIRSIESMKGSLQLFVDTPIDALAPGIFKQALEEADPEEVTNLKVFYFVFGQWDTGAHNTLILDGQETKHLIAIDNSGIKQRQYVRYGELPFVRTNYSEKLETDDWYGVPFPFDQVKTIPDPSPEKLKEVFGTAFPDSFYQSFKSYKSSLTYVIYQNSLWRQFHAGESEFVKSYTATISEKTYQTLHSLYIKTLKHIFENVPAAEFVTDAYLQAILERRDQVLKHTKVVAKLGS
jgi:hypothetical protein